MTQEELEKRLIELEYKASGAASLCGCLARLDLDGSARRASGSGGYDERNPRRDTSALRRLLNSDTADIKPRI